MKTQSSIALSKSNGKGTRGLYNSTSRYSRNICTLSHRKGLCESLSDNSFFFSSVSDSWSEIFKLFFCSAKTSSLNTLKCGSCVASPKNIKSASKPYIQCLVLGLYSGSSLCSLIKFIILCSPSPGTVASLIITCKSVQPGSYDNL